MVSQLVSWATRRQELQTLVEKQKLYRGRGPSRTKAEKGLGSRAAEACDCPRPQYKREGLHDDVTREREETACKLTDGLLVECHGGPHGRQRKRRQRIRELLGTCLVRRLTGRSHGWWGTKAQVCRNEEPHIIYCDARAN